MRHRNRAWCLAAWLLCTGSVGAQTSVKVEAFVGEPLGVARMTLPPRTPQESMPTSAYLLEGDAGRVLYPTYGAAAESNGLGALLGKGGLLSGQRPERRPSGGRRFGGLLRRLQESGILQNALQPSNDPRTVYFLFRGDKPFHATLYTPTATSFTVTPRDAPQQRDQLLQAWYAHYTAEARELSEQGNYPPLLDAYLPNMLAGRLGLPPLDAAPEKQGRQEPSGRRLLAEKTDTPQPSNTDLVQAETLELLFGAEKLRMTSLRRAFSNPRLRLLPADQPVPGAIAWLDSPTPEIQENIAMEPIARHVPQECFYVRFGTFANYLWLDGLKKEYDGELEAMITLRGSKAARNDRMQYQLAVRQSQLAEIFGGQAIADVAFIGRDFYLREGGAVGLLFQARNGPLLHADFEQQRKQALKEALNEGAKAVVVRIAGHDVSFLSTPDNRVHSYWAIDGDFHLITTSKEIVRRFYEVGVKAAGYPGSLAALGEFRRARKLMPLEREDTVFAYFSTPFMQALLAPAYQIELRRRLQAAADIELVKLAQLAAQAERAPSETLDALERGGFLPAGFQTRPDGGRPVIVGDQVVDSIRGAVGGFLPITDTPLTAITSHEAEQAARQIELYLHEWKQLDPLMVGVKRYNLNKQGLERVVVDGHVSLVAEKKYGRYLSMLGPLTHARLEGADDDIIFAQASLNPAFGGGPPHQFFGAIKDTDTLPPAMRRPEGFLEWLQLARSTPGYLGSWPNAGYLNLLPQALSPAPDPAGFSQLPFGLWRRQWDDFSVVSFDHSILEVAPAQIRVAEDEAAAQLRFHVGDLSQAKVRPWLNALLLERAMASSHGNAAFLNRLSAQFQLPRENALEVANDLLDTQLLCALEGKFEANRHVSGARFWTSNAWNAAEAHYQAPLWQWFRGAQGYVSKYDDQIFAHIELDLQRKSEEQKGAELPFFDFFRSKPQSPPKVDKAPEVIDTPPARRDGP